MRAFRNRAPRQTDRRRRLTISLGVASGLVALGGFGYALTTQAATVVAPITTHVAQSTSPTVTSSATISAIAVQPSTEGSPPATVRAAPVTTRRVAPSPTAAPKKKAGVVYTCDVNGPARFGDPAHPNVITNKACGYVDSQGRQRSRDPWIDGQLQQP